MINNRQNGRRRGRGGGGQRQGGGGNPNMGNRIDSRARGNAAQLHEKYKTLARDAQMQGDRVNTEYFLQFADHYFRVLAEQRGRADDQPQRRQREDSFDGDFDDYGDEGEPVRGSEQNGEQNGRDNYREERGQRDDRSQRDDRGNRDDSNRDDGQRGGGQREARGNRQARDDRGSREDAQRDDRAPRRGNRDQGRDTQDDRPRADAGDRSHDRGGDTNRNDDRATPVSVTPANDYDSAEPAEPRRRGRPRKVQVEAGDDAATFDAAILPPSLGITTTSEEGDSDGDPAEKPRRRRPRAAGGEVSQAS